MLFTFSLVGWGGYLCRRFAVEVTLLPAVLLGSFFLSLVMMLGGVVGALGDSFRFLYLIILSGGIFGLPFDVFKNFFAALKDAAHDSLILAPAAAILIFSGFLLSGASALIPFQDVFSYHLYSPWRWWVEGRIFFDPNYPHLFLASYWEHLYMWAFPLMGSEGNSMLGALIFSQWVHAGIGFGGTFLAIFSIMKHLRIPSAWSIVAAIAGSTIFPLLWTAWLAKNDFGALFWYLGSLYFLLRLRPVLAGLAAGMALAAKLSIFFGLVFVPVVIFILWPARKAIRPFFLFVSALLAGALPLFLRNALTTGNPVFPLLQNVFGGAAVSESMQLFSYGALESAGLEVNALSFFPVLFRIALKEPLLPICALLLGWALIRKRREEFSLLSIAVLSFGPPVLWLGYMAEDFLHIRYLAPAICLISFLPLLFLLKLKVIQKSRPVEHFLLVAILLFLFASRGYVPWRDLAAPGNRAEFFENYVSRSDGGACKAWMAENIGALSPVLSMEDDSLYLLPLKNVRVAFHDPKIDQIIRQEKRPEELFGQLRSLGVKFVYNTKHRDGNHYYPNTSEHQAWLRGKGVAHLFAANDCLVVDLHRL